MNNEIFEYYMRKDVQESIMDFCRNREVSVATAKGTHMKRPMVLQYSKDVESLVRDGGISFHCSVEHWKNPLLIRTGMSIEEMNHLRSGWDLIIDIDSMMGMEGAKVAAVRTVELLRKYGIEPSAKFSGSRGFHIGVESSALPEKIDYEKTSSQFPQIPRAIVSYIKEKIKEDLMRDLVHLKGSFKKLLEDLEDTDNFSGDDPYMFVDLENNWGNRHLFRAPYSINEKSGLVSMPIKTQGLEGFHMDSAKPHRVRTSLKFLDGRNDLSELAVSALDWYSSQQKKMKKTEKKKGDFSRRMPESRFPPCIKLIMEGLDDGKKRSILVLANFLKSMNWSNDEIREKITEWNQKNKPPLPETYINAQINWFEKQDKMLPPNCDNQQFMLGIGVCKPDDICRQGTRNIAIKNPAVYPFKKRK